MFLKHTFWLKGAIIFQMLTSAAHSLSFFFTPQGKNEQEKLLIDLMQNYRTDMGAGFSPSTQDIMTAFSACFALLYLLGALTLGYLLYRKADQSILKGIISIFILIFGICFVVMAVYTFILPILFTALVFACLLVSRLTIPKASK